MRGNSVRNEGGRESRAAPFQKLVIYIIKKREEADIGMASICRSLDVKEEKGKWGGK